MHYVLKTQEELASQGLYGEVPHPAGSLLVPIRLIVGYARDTKVNTVSTVTWRGDWVSLLASAAHGLDSPWLRLSDPQPPRPSAYLIFPPLYFRSLRQSPGLCI